jgi:TrmH family RNA methyltransferase
MASRENRRLVAARKVRDGKMRDLIFLEGKRLADEALRSNIRIEDCFVSDSFAESEVGSQFLKAANLKEARIAGMTDRFFDSIAATNHPQGIILLARRPATDESRLENCPGLNHPDSKMRIVVFLIEVNNPANLGAIMRTAEAAGVCGIIVSKNSADPFSPKALRAAMGATLRLPVWDKAGLDEALKWAAKGKFLTTAADTNAKKIYSEVDWTRPRLLIFGSEAHGLAPANAANIEESIRIPMENQVESLNLAVSAGIILFEAKRQNDLP